MITQPLTIFARKPYISVLTMATLYLMMILDPGPSNLYETYIPLHTTSATADLTEVLPASMARWTSVNPVGRSPVDDYQRFTWSLFYVLFAHSRMVSGSRLVVAPAARPDLCSPEDLQFFFRLFPLPAGALPYVGFHPLARS
ncbi:hypothetical protein E4T56_gene5190 [Termitomyces sp. T112]|nr:hypothetical protein E4T56_gene5190 [Termitomyces sp. T112]